MNKLKRKKGVCIIIGGNGIVGESICEVMINDWEVISISRTKNNKKEKNWKEYSCDVTKEKDFERIVNKIENDIGNIEVLINCACIRPMKKSFEDSISKWEESILKNSLSLFIPSRIISSKMAQRENGSIINVSSIYGMRGPKQNIYIESDFETEPDYAYNKSGAIGFSKYLASYMAEKKIRVNVVVLGGIENNQKDNFKKYYNDRVPLGRMCLKNEIGGIFKFLASKEASYITGSVICVDGGWTAT